MPANSGGGTGTFTCTETATATLATNVRYTDTALSDTEWNTEGLLTLQITEANYDSLEWYSTNKAILGAFAQNSTQSEYIRSPGWWSETARVRRVLTKSLDNCKEITATGYTNTTTRRVRARDVLPPGPQPVQETWNICKAGSNFQLIEMDPSSSTARELSFSLKFQASTEGDIFCTFLENVVEFIETTVNDATDTEAAIPGELEVDQKLLQKCEGTS